MFSVSLVLYFLRSLELIMYFLKVPDQHVKFQRLTVSEQIMWLLGNCYNVSFLEMWDPWSTFISPIRSCLFKRSSGMRLVILSLPVWRFQAYAVPGLSGRFERGFLWSCSIGACLSYCKQEEWGTCTWSPAQERCSQGALPAVVMESGYSTDSCCLLLEKTSRPETGWFA